MSTPSSALLHASFVWLPFCFSIILCRAPDQFHLNQERDDEARRFSSNGKEVISATPVPVLCCIPPTPSACIPSGRILPRSPGRFSFTHHHTRLPSAQDGRTFAIPPGRSAPRSVSSRPTPSQLPSCLSVSHTTSFPRNRRGLSRHSRGNERFPLPLPPPRVSVVIRPSSPFSRVRKAGQRLCPT